MNLEKTSVIIKKINRLYELIESIGEASHTERDLLKAYVLDLYEAVVISEPGDTLRDQDKEEMEEQIRKQKKAEKKLKKQLDKKSRAALEDEEDEPSTPADDSREESDDLPGEETEEQEKELTLVQTVPDEMNELFDIKDSPELSDKLANAPIRDLTRAMGINEKIFTVNELFDGNREEMDNILSALNGLSDFEEAKSVLVRSVASKYNWADEHRAKKAKSFIKLVRRRYIA